MAKRLSGRVTTLVVLSVLEVVVRAAATLIAQPLKGVLGPDRPLNIPFLLALVEASSAPISVAIWIMYCLQQKNSLLLVNWRYRLSMYSLCAFIDCASSILGAIGLLVLPATVFTILGSAAMVISMVLQRTFTDKLFTKWHYLSGAATIVSIALLVPTLPPSSTVESVSGPAPVSPNVAFACCLLSAFLISINGVLNYILVSHENIKYELGSVLENNAFQSIFLLVFMIPIAFSSSEASHWPETFHLIHSAHSMAIFTGLFAVVLLSRPITMFSSVGTTSFSSAILTRALGGPRRLLVVICSAAIFKEEMPPLKIVSTVLMTLSLAVYIAGGMELQRGTATKVGSPEVSLSTRDSLHEHVTTINENGRR